ncbi:MAG: ADP-forming succinate--CoA ligase subunit beta [Thermoleophilia bacterium]|nr:ADP-forming succinate--CoA ligase subunit beta [Thermoleophilia bacterium]
MDLYEHQGKELFAKHGVNVSAGRVAYTPEEAEAAARELGGQTVVKAQVHAGGRGKAGGVKLAQDPADAKSKAEDILGLDIKGHVVRRLWIEDASDIDREYYFSINFDRTEKSILLMLSTEGGMDIEQVAEETPDKLATMHINPVWGLRPFEARKLAFQANIDADVRNKVVAMMLQLYDAFIKEDAMLVEVNPLLITPTGEVKALDSKFTVDDNALFRHPDIAAMRDVQAQDPQEQMAHEKGVTYVKLDGHVGILGNGAGLVMSTLDVIQQRGGKPANFLDVGGGATAEEIVASLEIILSDVKVKSIFFNIFGGITRCTEVAQGIISALAQLEVNVPIVVRLDGTASVEGLQMLRDADLPNVTIAETMLDAAAEAVALANGSPATV